MNYETLFKPFEYYLLPDGTDVQAIWVDDAEPAYWILAPGDNPRASAAEHMQYRVHRDGTITAEHYTGRPQSLSVFQLPQVDLIHNGITDLCIDDLRPEEPKQ